MSENKLVYVLDDDTAVREAYAAALSRLGYRVRTAPDGLKGQELVKAEKPDLILLDMLMPHMDGIGFLKSLRQEPGTAAIEVIVISSFEALPETNALGVDKYLSKMDNSPEQVAAEADKLLGGASRQAR